MYPLSRGGKENVEPVRRIVLKCSLVLDNYQGWCRQNHGRQGIASQRRWRMCDVALVEGSNENKPVKLFVIICYVGVVWLKI